MKLEDKVIFTFTKGLDTMGDWSMVLTYASNVAVKTIVELGTAYGFNSMMLSHSGGEVYTVDNYEVYNCINMYESIKNYLEIYSKNRIHAIKNDTVKEALNWENESIDLLFIDGGHSYEQVKSDFYAWISKLKRHCIVFLHDVNEITPGVWKFYNKDISNEIKNGKLKKIDFKTEYQSHLKGFIKL